VDLHEYQQQAHKTEKKVYVAGSDIMVPILGMAGEVGELLNEYKKKLRDGDAHERFRDRVVEELGDILWYIAETATKFGIDLNQVAEGNLKKTRARWGSSDHDGVLFDAKVHAFDASFPEHERFPRRFVADFRPRVEDGAEKARVFVDGKQMGDLLTDNAHTPDGYRFHDVFHLACAAVLGWSPVIRKHLGCKRRSDPKIDEVEDGGRAIVTEEGISALVFAYARDHKSLDGVKSVDYDLLKAIRIMTSSFEVAVCTTGEWERAILMGYGVWKKVERNQGGKIDLDLDKRTISYLGMV
jgi:NTP pyrophosphatase (non-canonical NTP hydrolase)